MNLREIAEHLYTKIFRPDKETVIASIEAALLSVRNETIEECAKVAEKHPVPRATWGITTRGEITKKIRSLRGEEKDE